MSTIATLMNHQVMPGAVSSRAAASPMASSTTGASGTGNSSAASSSSATVSANDFLTLLVTEMQNQDPTATTDPNEYINQLVNVNSLEQLIDINQTLSTAVGAPSSASNNGSSPRVVTDASSPSHSITPATAARSPHATPLATAPQAGSVFGNLSVPLANRAAERVGHSLGRITGAQPDEGIAPRNR
jgi:flagellar basal-body rod modification protein FlgD